MMKVLVESVLKMVLQKKIPILILQAAEWLPFGMVIAGTIMGLAKRLEILNATNVMIKIGREGREGDTFPIY